MAQTNVLLPTGRLVSGDVYSRQETDAQGQPHVFKRGPKTGQPRDVWFFAIAIPKAGESHWSQTAWGQHIWQIGHAFKPNAGNMPDFAWKIIDGDDPRQHVDREGAPRERKTYRSAWVLRISGGYAPHVATLVGRQNPEYDTTPGLIYPGCYVQAQLRVDANGDQQKPGVYLNPGIVCLIGFGERIEGAQVDVSKVGFAAGPLPAGAFLAPPGVAAMPPVAAPVVPAYQPPPVVAPAAPAVPNPAFLMPPVPVVAAEPQLTAKAPAGATYKAFRDAGWTDEQMRSQGFLA